MDSKIYTTNSAEETEKLGKEIGKSLILNSLLLLTGDLGSGKTTFVKGLAIGIGVKKRIISPTFIMLRSYPASKERTLNHIDLYRFENEDQIKSLGLTDLISSDNTITVIEWAEKIKKISKNIKTIKIQFKYINESQREIKIDE